MVWVLLELKRRAGGGAQRGETFGTRLSARVCAARRGRVAMTGECACGVKKINARRVAAWDLSAASRRASGIGVQKGFPGSLRRTTMTG